MKTNKLITDTNPIDQPAGSHRRAYNILVNKAKGATTNDEGFEMIATLNRNVVYALPIDDDRLVIFSLDIGAELSTGSEISILDKYGNLTTILKDDGIGFQTKSPMKAVWVRNFKGELVVSWVDGLTNTKILNLDKLPFEVDVNLSLVNPQDIILLDMNPKFKFPLIDLVGYKDSGGQLDSGVYYFTAAYELPDGGITPWGHIMGPVTVTDDTSSDDTTSYDGAEPGTVTGKSIPLTISNIDQRYKYVKVAVIKKINGLVTSESFTRQYIESDTLEVTYHGGEDVEDLILEEVLTESTGYTSAGTIAYLNNTLYLGNLKGNLAKEYNYQPIANDIKIDWVTDTVRVDQVEGSYKDEHTIFTKRGFFPDEVYAFYVRLLFTDGTKSDAFHIPGPKAETVDPSVRKAGEPNFSVLNTLQSIKDDVTITGYQTPFEGQATINDKEHFNHDLGIGPDVKFFHTRETALNQASNNMGVWYNKDEKYPNDPESWGTNANTPVRHHKFPGLDMFVDIFNPILQGTGNSEIKLATASDLLFEHDKFSQRNGQNWGQAIAIPLKVDNTFDPAIQNQSEIVLERGTNSQSIGDTTLYQYCDYITDAQVGYYKWSYSEFGGLMFLNKARKAQTITVEYDLSWVYTIASTYTNPDQLYRVSIIHFKDGATVGQTAHPYLPYGNEADPTRYVLDSFSQMAVNEGILREASGSFNIPIVEGDSLSLVLEVYSPPDTGTDRIAISAHFYKTDLKVYPQGQVQNNDGVTAKVLGIKASNVVIPAEIASNVEGYELLYAKRDYSSQRIVGQSLMFGSAQHPLNPDGLGSHAGNNLTLVKKGDTVNDGVSTYLRDDRLRFHAFDLLKDRPAVSPSFVKIQARFQSYLQSRQFIDDKYYDPQDEARLLDSPVQSHYKVDLVRAPTNSYSGASEKRKLRPVRNFKYLPGDTVVSNGDETLDNSYSEECATMDVEHYKVEVDQSGNYNNTYYSWLLGNDDFLHHEDAVNNATELLANYYMGNLYIHRTNMYTSMFEQELVATNKVHLTSGAPGTFSTPNVFGGDTFFSLYGIRLTSALFWKTNKYYSTNNDEALKTIFYFPCYTVSNVNLRHAGDTPEEDYYPHVGASFGAYREWVKRPADIVNTNTFLYNEDYTSVNDMNLASSYNTEEEFVSEFPYRIIKSKTYLPEDKEFSLRIFLSNDYYEMPKHRGPIVNLEGSGSALFVHHKYSLFKTTGQEKLATDTTEIALGTGDIFRIPPTELIHTDTGYLGTKHMQSAKLTKLGYLSIDAEQGKISLVSDKLEEITNTGNRNYFRKHLPLKIVEQLKEKGYTLSSIDNAHQPYGVGYNTAFDDKWNRLIISKKDFELADPNVVLDFATASEGGLVFVDGGLYIKVGAGHRLLNAGEIATHFVDKSFTISYSADDKAFVCFHNYVPDIMVNTRNNVFSMKDGKVYLHNQEGYAKYYDGAVYASSIDVVFNQAPTMTKQAQSLQWISEIIDGNEVNLYEKTFTEVLAWNSYQNTGSKSLTNLTNVRNSEGTWNFNILRDLTSDRAQPTMDKDGEVIISNIDINKPWYDQKRMVDKYLIVRLLYDNIDQNALYLYDIEASLIKSHR